MIFVTVGTHEQQFDRLIKYIDFLKKDKIIGEDVIIQTGFCKYKPQYCRHKEFFSYNKMINLIKSARIVITHGGVSSFILALQWGKIPIVVPRRKEFSEHINDHQLEFARFIKQKRNNIILVEDINLLKKYILLYDEEIKNMKINLDDNNDIFNRKIEKLIVNLYSKNKRG